MFQQEQTSRTSKSLHLLQKCPSPSHLHFQGCLSVRYHLSFLYLNSKLLVSDLQRVPSDGASNEKAAPLLLFLNSWIKRPRTRVPSKIEEKTMGAERQRLEWKCGSQPAEGSSLTTDRLSRKHSRFQQMLLPSQMEE